MELVEVRRLTGPNLLLDGPAAVMDVRCDDPAGVGERLRTRVDQHRAALRIASPLWRDWADEQDALRCWSDDGGFTYAFAAPVDLLYAACEVLEAAWSDIEQAIGRLDTIPLQRVGQLLEASDDEVDAPLLALLAAAREHVVAGVWDDDEVSVGLGRMSRTWSRSEVPNPDDVPWDDVSDVPVALITGTNGKSTTVRMLAGILRAAGRVPGTSSTDGIVIDGELVEAGDWSGPGGGRTVARDRRVGTMVLEVARGGLLRRGLPVDRADVAIVTNIADDHLGEYGIESLDELTEAKLVVAKGVRDGGVLVTNAEDPLLVAHAPRGPGTAWFAVAPEAPHLATALDEGSTCWTVVDGVIVRRTADGDTAVVGVEELPATYGGAARHNVANALAAAAAAHVLDVSLDDVATGLRAFVPDASTNPGRANSYDLDGVRIVVDFAHNVHAVEAMAGLAAALGGERTCVLFSQAGDRSDDALDDLAGAVHATAPHRYVVADVPKYLRGREPMEVPQRLAAALLARGVDEADVIQAPDAVDGTQAALAWAEPGDVLLLLTLQHRAEVDALLRERGATPVQ